MKTNHHEAFKQFILNNHEVIEAHRISGGGCYFLKVKVNTQESLNSLLDRILEYGNYQIHLSIGEMKHTHPLNAILES